MSDKHLPSLEDTSFEGLKQNENNPDYHFAGIGKMIEIGKGVSDAIRHIGDDLPERI